MKRMIVYSILTLVFVSYGESPTGKLSYVKGNKSFYGNIEFVRSETSSLINPLLNEKKCFASAVIRQNSKDGEIVTDAVISVNNKKLSYNPFVKNYVASMPDVIPGTVYNISITIGELTYTDSIMFPGGITIINDGVSVSWEHSGSLNQLLTMKNSGGACTNIWDCNANSPTTVPPQAYSPAGNIFTLRVLCQNSIAVNRSDFAGLTILAKDIKSADFKK